MRNDELESIRNRAERASLGALHVELDPDAPGYFLVLRDGHPVAHWWGDYTSDDTHDVAFLAHAREDILALLAEIDCLHTQVSKLTESSPHALEDS